MTPATYTPQIKEALQALAARCDGAWSDDGHGFNKPDSHLGKALAASDPSTWTPFETRKAWEMLAKYKGQLSMYGVDYDAIPEPPVADKPEAKRAVTLVDSDAVIRFPFNRELVGAVKGLPGRRWNPSTKAWTAPPSRQLAAFIERHSFAAAHDVIEACTNAEEVAEEEKAPELGITLEDGVLVVRFPYNPQTVIAIKAVPGRKWDNDRKVWTVPVEPASVAALIDFCADRPGFEVPSEVSTLATQQAESAAETLAASKAEDADIEVPGLQGTPYPFQRAGIAYAIKARRCIIADEMGLGKTIQALGAIQAEQAYPALIVVPASLKLNWQREANKWLPSETRVMVLGGRKAPKADALKGQADVFVINYDVLTSWKATLRGLGLKAVIADEAHYLKNGKAQRTKAFKAISKAAGEDALVVLLTGTPVLNRPSELISPLGILGHLDTLGGFWEFAFRYCGAHHTRFGLDLSGARNLEELNERLRSLCMVRRKKEQVLKELPPKVRTSVPLDLSNRREYDRAAADIVSWCGEQAAAAEDFRSELAGLSDTERKRAIKGRMESAEWKAQQAEQLVRIEALKQVCVKGKMAAALDWIGDFLESGEKLVLFATHKSVVKEVSAAIVERGLSKSAPVIFGETPIEARQAAVDAFQTDPEVKVIVGNLKAMGVGLTLTSASNVAFLEYGWTPADHDQAEDRCHRIGQESSSVNVWNLIAEGTIDEEIVALIDEKRQVVNAATDGQPMGKSKGILSELLKRLAA